MTAGNDHLTRFKQRGLIAVGLFAAMISAAVLLASVGGQIEPGTAAPVSSAPRDPDAPGRRERLAQVKSWQDLRGDDQAMAAVGGTADLIAIDPQPIGRMTQAERVEALERLRRRADGGSRIVLAHLSIGAIEPGRPFWGAAWVAMGSSAAVRHSATAPFWDQSWHDQLYGRPEALLDRLIAQGFDGVVLADAEAHRIAADVENASQKMAQLIARLAAHARRQNPYFIVMLAGAEELLTHPPALGGIDAVVKHDLYHGLNGHGANDDVDVTSSLLALRAAVRSGHPIFVSERVALEDAPAVVRRIAAMGFVADVRSVGARAPKAVWSKVKL